MGYSLLSLFSLLMNCMFSGLSTAENPEHSYFRSMSPFNIKVRHSGQMITFTVLPEEEDRFKIIYFGAILGEIRLFSGNWSTMPVIDSGSTNLPLFHAGRQDAALYFEWNESVAKLIGIEIEHFRAEHRPA